MARLSEKFETEMNRAKVKQPDIVDELKFEWRNVDHAWLYVEN